MAKVILLEDVPGQGKKNDVINVSDGFARNYLLPQKKAVYATSDEVLRINKIKDQAIKRGKLANANNLKLKEKIRNEKIEITAKARGGKLFGSVTQKEISDALMKKGIHVSKNQIKIKNPIRKTGDFKVIVEISKEVDTILSLRVVGN